MITFFQTFRMHNLYSLIALASFMVTTASAQSITSVDTATCTPQSINACPTAYDPCCAFICAEAQVPFDVCSPSNRTELAVCSQCPSTTMTATLTTSISITPTPTITTAPSLTLSTSTCTGRLLSTAGCPTPYDPCCAYVCEEAQVPFDVCSQTDGSGEFAVCSKCPSPTPGP